MSGFFDIQTPKQHVGSNFSNVLLFDRLKG